MNNPIIGVDPGLSGAVCYLEHEYLSVMCDFKTVEDIASAVNQFTKGRKVTAVVEKVGARPGQGVVSMFNFGKAAGAALGALYYTGCDVTEVFPQKWQNHFRRKHSIFAGQPFDSREIARKEFPGYLALFKRVKDHNSADAALIARWLQETGGRD